MKAHEGYEFLPLAITPLGYMSENTKKFLKRVFKLAKNAGEVRKNFNRELYMTSPL